MCFRPPTASVEANECPECGAELLIGAQTCRQCGAKIGDGTGFPSVSAVAAPKPLTTDAPPNAPKAPGAPKAS